MAYLVASPPMWRPRGWRVLLQLPAVGLRELDIVPLHRGSNGTALSELLDLMPGRVSTGSSWEWWLIGGSERFIMVDLWFVLVR